MEYDLIIIGSGPAGYVAAIRAGKTGLKTLVIDKKYVGGMCLNWGCIPTKSLLESAKMMRKVKQAHEFGIAGIDPMALSFDWEKALARTKTVVNKLTKGIEFLWKKNGVEFLKAEAKILSPNEVQADNRTFQTKNILVATGSKPEKQTIFPDAIELEDIYQLSSLPENPVLYGRGANLVELAQFFAMIGKKPTILATDFPLIPQLDEYLDAFIQKKLKKDKIPVIPISEVKIENGKIIYKDNEIAYDKVINASFRKATLPPMDIALELLGGFIKTNSQHESSVKGIFAAGDVNGKSFLAHVASAQALEVIDTLQGVVSSPEPRNYPLNVYTDPEMAQIGKTEAEVKDMGIDYKVNLFSMAANGKALCEGETEGFIRLIYETKYHEVLGVQIVSANATDLISEAGVLLDLEGTTFDLAKTVHAHPTIAEVFMDVAEI